MRRLFTFYWLCNFNDIFLFNPTLKQFICLSFFQRRIMKTPLLFLISCIGKHEIIWRSTFIDILYRIKIILLFLFSLLYFTTLVCIHFLITSISMRKKWLLLGYCVIQTYFLSFGKEGTFRKSSSWKSLPWNWTSFEVLILFWWSLENIYCFILRNSFIILFAK